MFLWFNQFCLYCANFFSIRSMSCSFKILSCFLCSNKLYPVVHLMNFISTVFSLLVSCCFNVEISQPDQSDWITKIISKKYINFHLRLSLNQIKLQNIIQNSLTLQNFTYFWSYVPSSSCEMLYSKYVDLFTCSNSIYYLSQFCFWWEPILLMPWLGFGRDNLFPYCFVVLCKA